MAKKYRKISKKGLPHTGLTTENYIEYGIYRAMLSRCFNKNNPSTKYYNARGITITDRWLGRDGFKNFLEDMGKRPDVGYSIDRIDVDGDYCPENCRWATWLTQARNRRNNNETVGVARHNQNGGWSAYISINGVRRMRCFRTREEAVAQRLKWEAEVA